MELTYRRSEDNVLVIVGDGTLDERNADDLLGEATRAMEQGVRQVVLDCAHIKYVSSYGLGALVRLHTRAIDRGSVFVLTSVSERLFTLLHMLRLHDVFPMARTVDEARRNAAAPAQGSHA